MWKERYKLGNDLIDAQHKELFDKTEKLLGMVDGEDFAAKKQECIDTILFLKKYAIKHFAEEEEFQASLGYEGIDMHKLIHSDFIDSVLSAEQKLIAADFSLSSIKEFCGFLTAWLIYHVAGADQKIVNHEEITYDEMAILLSPDECFMHSIDDVFATLLSEPTQVAESSGVLKSDDAIHITMEASKHWNGEASFTFSKETGLGLVNALAELDLTEVDELAYAALYEIASLIMKKAVSLMPKNGKVKKSKLPEMTVQKNDFAFNTKHGLILLSVSNS